MKAAIVAGGISLLCMGAYAVTPTPVCHNARQCGAMWAAAQVAIGVATGMSNRIVTDTLVETHPATHHSRLTGVVRKIPTGQEGYKIVIDLSCYQTTQCDDIARAGTELFNTLVINAGAGLGPLPEASIVDRIA
jgi:hypothetical protein